MAVIFVVLGESGHPITAQHDEAVALEKATAHRREHPEQAHLVSTWSVPVGRSVGVAERVDRTGPGA